MRAAREGSPPWYFSDGKWGEGGEGMPAATSNKPERGLPVAALMVPWQHSGAEQRERGEGQVRQWLHMRWIEERE
jgi:hypothetical protein